MKTRNTKSQSAHVDRLYKAVQNYVEKSGGKLSAIGGIFVQDWFPGDNSHIFYVAVKCLGRKPPELVGTATGGEGGK